MIGERPGNLGRQGVHAPSPRQQAVHGPMLPSVGDPEAPGHGKSARVTADYGIEPGRREGEWMRPAVTFYERIPLLRTPDTLDGGPRYERIPLLKRADTLLQPCAVSSRADSPRALRALLQPPRGPSSTPRSAGVRRSAPRARWCVDLESRQRVRVERD